MALPQQGRHHVGIRWRPAQPHPFRLIELISEALSIEPRIERHPPQPGDVQRTFADIGRARRLLGYRPTTQVEDGIPLFIDWIRSEAS